MEELIMTIELGLQLYSVRDELAKDFVGTLEKVASIGYKNLELLFHDADHIEENVGELKADELKQELDRLGMRAVSAHISPLFLNPEKMRDIIKFSKVVGISKLVLSIAFFKDKQSVLDLCKQMNKIGEVCKGNGLQLYYHNHFEVFQKFEDQYVMDIILQNTDQSLVKVEFDTYWSLRGGVDPIEYLTVLGDRCDLLHQKDLPASVDPVNIFEKIGEDANVNMELMMKLQKAEDFTEVGQGVMNIPGIIEAFRSKPGAKYLFIEQDWTTKKQLESIEISYHYISKYFE